MKQYCRYCCNACLNDDELAYCRYKDEMLEGPALRRLNHCKGFLFCEIDVLTQTRIYKPRSAKPPLRPRRIMDRQLFLMLLGTGESWFPFFVEKTAAP